MDCIVALFFRIHFWIVFATYGDKLMVQYAITVAVSSFTARHVGELNPFFGNVLDRISS